MNKRRTIFCISLACLLISFGAMFTAVYAWITYGKAGQNQSIGTGGMTMEIVLTQNTRNDTDGIMDMTNYKFLPGDNLCAIEKIGLNTNLRYRSDEKSLIRIKFEYEVYRGTAAEPELSGTAGDLDDYRYVAGETGADGKAVSMHYDPTAPAGGEPTEAVLCKLDTTRFASKSETVTETTTVTDPETSEETEVTTETTTCYWYHGQYKTVTDPETSEETKELEETPVESLTTTTMTGILDTVLLVGENIENGMTRIKIRIIVEMRQMNNELTWDMIKWKDVSFT